MILQARTLDLARIIKIFGTDETNDCIDLIGAVAFGETITARFEHKLIPAIVRLGREFGTLTGFKVHEVRAFGEAIFFRHLISLIDHADGYAE